MKRSMRFFVAAFLAMTSCFAAASTAADETGVSILPASAIDADAIDKGTQQSPSNTTALTFIEQGKSFIAAKKFAEAKDALRTAIRIEPMNLEAWKWYDSATEMYHVSRVSHAAPNAIIDSDSHAILKIQRIETFREFGNLYLVGEIQNLSLEPRRNIEVTATLVDAKTQEIHLASSTARTGSRGLLPNEQILFKIPVRDPLTKLRASRVQITRYE